MTACWRAPASFSACARSAAARGSEVALSRWSGFFILIAVLALLGGVTAGLAWVDQRNDPDAPALLSAAILLLSVAISGAFFREDWLLNIAGLAAICVALFPTSVKCGKVKWETVADRIRQIRDTVDVVDVSLAPWRAELHGELACLTDPRRFGAPWTTNAH